MSELEDEVEAVELPPVEDPATPAGFSDGVDPDATFDEDENP